MNNLNSAFLRFTSPANVFPFALTYFNIAVLIRERDLVVRRVFREFEADFRVFAEEGVTSVFHDAVLQQIETRKEFFLVESWHLKPAAFLRGDIEIVKRLVVEAIEGMTRETFFPFRGIIGVEEEPFELVGRHLPIFRAVSRKVFPSA